MSNTKIAVAGTGYVGLSLAVLLAQHNKVTAVDIIPEKVEKINNRISPIQDEYIEKYLAEKELDLTATLDAESAYKDADFVIIDFIFIITVIVRRGCNWRAVPIDTWVEERSFLRYDTGSDRRTRYHFAGVYYGGLLMVYSIGSWWTNGGYGSKVTVNAEDLYLVRREDFEKYAKKRLPSECTFQEI